MIFFVKKSYRYKDDPIHPVILSTLPILPILLNLIKNIE
ncbi:MAG: hypothetical protein ACI8RA_002279 [Chlamydiales bacterium]|jgi:hypothetical protein